jgi:hypothetical protein
MPSPMTNKERSDCWLCGYICAVLTSSAAFAVTPPAIFWFSVGQLPATALVMAGILFVAAATVAFLTTWLPVYLVWRLARSFSIASFWYYVTFGALTGLILSPLAAVLQPHMFWDPPEPSLFHRDLVALTILLMPSGFIGGLAFWLSTGRYFRKDISHASP